MSTGTPSKIYKSIATHIPGTAASIAAAKRKMERELRASGLTLKAAKKAVSEHFRRD